YRAPHAFTTRRSSDLKPLKTSLGRIPGILAIGAKRRRSIRLRFPTSRRRLRRWKLPPRGWTPCFRKSRRTLPPPLRERRQRVRRSEEHTSELQSRENL